MNSFYDTARQHPEIFIVTVNTDEDHVHMQLEIAPSVSVASAIGRLKANAAIALKRDFKFIKKMYLSGSIWSVGYFSSTIGLNEATIRKYVENQGRNDMPTQQQGLGFE
jgi:putative transposase